jgi:excinuclease ABC subunit A
MGATGQISLRGVAVHNLKAIDLDIPRRKLVVFCGLSGSGKTSLALDTLYAEGQRRYIESFSAYTRQFLDRLEKPEAECIDGLPPAIAVTGGGGSRSSRSTVGTTTEVADYLRLLFAKIGKVVCRQCGRPVQRDTPQSTAAVFANLPAGTRYMLAFPVEAGGEGLSPATAAALREEGFVRAIVGQRVASLDEAVGCDQRAGAVRSMVASAGPPVAANGGPVLASSLVPPYAYVVVDRLSAGSTTEQRIRDSLEIAFSKGGGKCFAFVDKAEMAPDSNAHSPERRGALCTIDGRAWRRLAFTSELACADCGIEYLPPEPRLFSFNSPLGACPKCEGFGNVVTVDMLRVSRWRSYRPCPACGGTRLRPEALDARVGGRNIAEVSAMQVGEAAEFFRNLADGKGDRSNLSERPSGPLRGKLDQSPFPLSDYDRRVGRMMLEQVQSRLGYLASVGLGYLTLDRMTRTLSGGELRRVALTSALGSSLVNMLYVLDEPSIGLHPADVDRLVDAVRKLRDRGNTVVVVEHEEAMIRAADRVVEIGPGAGERGGRIVFQGTPAEMAACPESLTGDYLAGRRGASGNGSRRSPNRGSIRLAGARGNNLKNITVEFPLGMLCLVTGVSGSGKSTLVEDTLYPALCRRLRKDAPEPLECDDVVGDGQIDEAILVDQGPIGRSPRSNPVTYLKIFDEIRNAFAATVEARTRNYDASYFSFNLDAGRCSACQGDGYLKIDMQFLPDVYMKCGQCHGTRYRDEILDVTYRGRNIAEVLEMTVREAFIFFRGKSKLQARLKRLIDVGLDYLRLGQPANTLSGGESQRLKLAAYMSKAKRGRCLFILDEPTTGLHFSDVVQLLDCFDALLAVGHSLIVVEHNLQMMKAADYIIDLGPGAADRGGQVVAQGTPEEVARNADSATGRFLRRVVSSAAPTHH